MPTLFTGPDFSDEREIAMTNQNTLRKVVGLSGMLLPVLLYLFLLVDTGFTKPMPSISHYYLTRANPVFIIVVSLMAVFLIIYKGKDRIDFILSVIAGCGALLLLLFPTNNLSVEGCRECVVTTLRESAFRPVFHLLSAAVFLLSLAGMALFLFTRSAAPKGRENKAKKQRNLVYRICGYTIIGALAVMVLGFKLPAFGPFYDANNLTFWMETVAVEAFGFAWFVKGNTILRDRNEKAEEKRAQPKTAKAG